MNVLLQQILGKLDIKQLKKIYYCRFVKHMLHHTS